MSETTLEEALRRFHANEAAFAAIEEGRPIEDVDPEWDSAYTKVQASGLFLLRKLIPEYERLRDANAVLGGEWCAENRQAGRGPCGACAWCCANPTKERWLEIGMQKGWLKPTLAPAGDE